MLYRNFELRSNEAGQGIQGLGVADPNYLAIVKQNQAAHGDEEAAAQYEKDIKEGVDAAKGVGLTTANMDQNTRNAILSSQTGLYNTRLQTQQPQWWKQLLLGAGSAAAPAAMAAI